ncbi:MAG: dTDP-glucose 4,6-dehydratase [Thermodesulfobacteriota bacterium]|nr:dTDP-glucose 4,6-dehydratase [Thermodesulfobacteriota bacterium]
MNKKILVTGGAGFIGVNFVRYILAEKPDCHIVNLDALTYAGNMLSLATLSDEQQKRHTFVHGSICDGELLKNLFAEHAFAGVVHFAAESHVDRSISGPMPFVETNVGGTCILLQAALEYWQTCSEPELFRFHHVSTDEVYGSLGAEGSFSETTSYDPSSPYSASKAASDHFVRAYHRTYGLPVLITNCSNNYGPYQFPEKLIPLMTLNILEKKALPIYGEGENIRDWLYVQDHCEALLRVFEQGKAGETYNIGGGEELTNIEIVRTLCALLDEKLGRQPGSSEALIAFVKDRPGHDFRYAIDATKISTDLNWQPRFTFKQAINSTVDWYLANMEWINGIRSGEYRQWLEKNYNER